MAKIRRLPISYFSIEEQVLSGEAAQFLDPDLVASYYLSGWKERVNIVESAPPVGISRRSLDVATHDPFRPECDPNPTRGAAKACQSGTMGDMVAQRCRCPRVPPPSSTVDCVRADYPLLRNLECFA